MSPKGMPCFNRAVQAFSFLVVFWILFSLAPLGLDRFKQVLSSDLDSPLLWQDEAASVEPLMAVYEGGYFNFRCLAAPWLACYGGGQIFFDALLLKFFPKKWLESKEIQQPPGKPWPWLLTYPHIGKVLRLSRIAAMAGVLLLLFWIASPGGAGFASLLTVALAASPIFITSWQGIKNDFTSSFWIIIFYLLFMRALLTEVERKRFWLMRICGGFAVFVASVRLSSAPVLFSCGVVWVLAEFLKGTRPKVLLREIVKVLALSFLVYLILNPGFAFKAAELRWFRPYVSLALSGASFWDSFLFETPRIIESFWPLLPAVFISGAFLIRHKEKRNSVLGFWAIFVPSLLLLAVTVIKSAHGRTHYFFPLQTGVFLFLALAGARFSTLSKSAHALICSAFIISLNPNTVLNWTDSFMRWNEIITSRQATKDPATEVFVKNPEKNWLLEINTRIPVPAEQEASKKLDIKYFDSLSVSPLEIVERHPAFSGNILVPCFAFPFIEPVGQDPAFTSPSLKQWAELSGKWCKEKMTVSERLFHPYFFASRVEIFSIVPFQEFKREVLASHLKTPVLENQLIHPRTLQGGIEGAEEWDGPYFFRKPFSLRQKLRFKNGASRIRVRAHSSCKQGGALRVTFSEENSVKPLVSIERELNVENPFCQHYHPLCQIPFAPFQRWFRGWVNRYFEVEPIEAQLDVRRGKVGTISISSDAAQSEDCLVALRPIEVLPKVSSPHPN